MPCDEAYLKDAAVAMMQCIVASDVLGKDGAHVWGAAVLLASVHIDNGLCSYGFAPHLRHEIYNPDMSARLDLDLQKQFKSKYALALWELCTDSLGGKRDSGETPWITLEDFRTLMGIAAGMYPLYKLFSQRVLTPALAEINRVSDFRVTVAYQRHGRQITALKFTMRRVVGLPDPSTLSPRHASAPDGIPGVMLALQAAGLAPQEAWDIWRQGFAVVAEDVRPRGAHNDAEAAFTEHVQEKFTCCTVGKPSGKWSIPPGFSAKRSGKTTPIRSTRRNNSTKPDACSARPRWKWSTPARG